MQRNPLDALNPFADVTDERRAAHEAGHVVAGLFVRWPFTYVTIERHPDLPDFWGHVHWERSPAGVAAGEDTWTLSDFVAWMAAVVGSIYGEFYLLGDYGLGSELDLRSIRHSIENATSEAAKDPQLYARAIQLAWTAVGNQIAMLRAIADALVEHRHLTHAEVWEIAERTVTDEARPVLEPPLPRRPPEPQG